MTRTGGVNYVWARSTKALRAERSQRCSQKGLHGMEHFWEILTKADNLPIVGMLLAVIFCLWVAFRQALKHDKLIAQGKKDDVYSEMIK